MKGDWVEIVIDAGGGSTKTYEVTRSGAVVRTARFMSSRVLALVEHPAPRRPDPAGRPSPGDSPPD